MIHRSVLNGLKNGLNMSEKADNCHGPLSVSVSPPQPLCHILVLSCFVWLCVCVSGCAGFLQWWQSVDISPLLVPHTFWQSHTCLWSPCQEPLLKAVCELLSALYQWMTRVIVTSALVLVYVSCEETCCVSCVEKPVERRCGESGEQIVNTERAVVENSLLE